MSQQNDISVAMYNLFENDPRGVQVFDFLVARFYDCDLYAHGDSHDTSYAVGQRDVIRFIINKMKYAQLPQENKNDIPEEE